MFFSAPNEYKPCGMFTIGHFIFLIVTIIGICYKKCEVRGVRCDSRENAS